MDNPVVLILGGARSGKSSLAERLARRHPGQRAYIATAEAFDREMEERIALHKAMRGGGWLEIEAPLDIANAIQTLPTDHAVVIDCLTLWLSNLMHAGRDPAAEGSDLLKAALARTAPVLLVSNEVGLGIVPETPLGRRFRDAQGRLNQQIAAEAATVVFVAAGLPLALKGELP